MNIHTIDELNDLNGKYILLRADFNVQIVDGKITDAFRIESSLPTIQRLANAGARIAVISHLGRPNGEKNPKYTLAPIAITLSELLGRPVSFVSDCIGEPVSEAREKMQNGDVILLENLRFYADEEKNDLEFSKNLSDGFDYFVNDAFAISHRAHASTHGVTKYIPSFAGELLSREIREITALMESPKRPLLGIVSGAKVSSKIGVLKSLVKLCDKLIIGGGLGNTFAYALGMNIGKSLHEADEKETAQQIMLAAKHNDCDVVLSIDKGVAKEFKADAIRKDKLVADIEFDDIILDEGPISIKKFQDAIDSVETVVWNGPVGVAEWQPVWSNGTFELAKHIAERTRSGKLKSIIGGGDVVAALEATGTKDAMTYVSTGGGAFLEFIEGQELPGIKALEK